ncbi:hypothetical protein [Aeromicrobium endophyticum]|uniref:Uncharacterized protein n=1 Tax=Aeromicrobium endophyticum TaxID=2292704 RepID=A0A371PCJ4_9ACTN|nr:hypothetical protein [Aeromicrobium endophyticum]REK73659.1 hypothetical protein DX116_09040 [Aeromicrobium endophyticum]
MSTTDHTIAVDTGPTRLVVGPITFWTDGRVEVTGEIAAGEAAAEVVRLLVDGGIFAAHVAAVVEGKDAEIELLRADVERFRPLWASPLAPPERWVSESIPYPRRYVSTFDVLKTYDESIRCSSAWPREKRHAAMDKALNSIPDLAYEIDHLRRDLDEARAAMSQVVCTVCAEAIVPSDDATPDGDRWAHRDCSEDGA